MDKESKKIEKAERKAERKRNRVKLSKYDIAMLTIGCVFAGIGIVFGIVVLVCDCFGYSLDVKVVLIVMSVCAGICIIPGLHFYIKCS